MSDLHAMRDGLVVTAFWQVNPGETDNVVEILRKFLPQAQRESGVKAFQIHQSLSEPEKLFFYEVFRDEAAFAEHQQSEHFKTLIAGEALPRLAKRERTQYRFV
jgi:quinol monooxygenase YgiN